MLGRPAWNPSTGVFQISPLMRDPFAAHQRPPLTLSYSLGKGTRLIVAVVIEMDVYRLTLDTSCCCCFESVVAVALVEFACVARLHTFFFRINVFA